MSAADLSDDVLAATARQRLIALFVVYDSSALTKVDRLLGEFSGRERNLFRVLASRFGISLDQALHVAQLYEEGRLAPGPPAAAAASSSQSLRRRSEVSLTSPVLLSARQTGRRHTERHVVSSQKQLTRRLHGNPDGSAPSSPVSNGRRGKVEALLAGPSLMSSSFEREFLIVTPSSQGSSDTSSLSSRTSAPRQHDHVLFSPVDRASPVAADSPIHHPSESSGIPRANLMATEALLRSQQPSFGHLNVATSMPAIAEDSPVAHPLLDDSFDVDAMSVEDMRQALQELTRERDVLKATLAKVGKYVGASKRLKKQSPQLHARGSPAQASMPSLQLTTPASTAVAVDAVPLTHAIAELTLKVEQLIGLKTQLEHDVLSLIDSCRRPADTGHVS